MLGSAAALRVPPPLPLTALHPVHLTQVCPATIHSRLLGSAATALSEGAQAAVPGPAASGVRGMVELLQQEEQEALDAGLEALASSAQQQQQQLSANSR